MKFITNNYWLTKNPAGIKRLHQLKPWRNKMTNDNLERMKRKIEKLLALSHNTSNEHEANNAMDKASKLMEKYHVETGDLKGSGIVKISKTLSNAGAYYSSGEKFLMNAICKSMGVYMLVQKGRRKGYYQPAIKPRFLLIGNESDIEIAWYMFEQSFNQIRIESMDYKQFEMLKGHKVTVKANNDYKIGLCNGLIMRFNLMTARSKERNKEAGTGMVTVDSRYNDAEMWFLNQGGRVKNTSISTRQNSYTDAGMKDSDRIRLNAGVKNQNKTMRLS